ncbi:MAG: hypothetical protein GWP59_07220 [Chlamydiales bacterium]|jgi:flagellar basal body-associated protein FliL|nr:flagellar basal body-associated FliL family protein [Chlamydiales bacterium]NCF71474.1 hypothetical protein [Chlamydiales bacterium]
MAEETENDEEFQTQKPSMVPWIMLGLVIVIAIGAIGAVFYLKSGNEKPVEKPTTEFVVEPQIYQLQDGSYLDLGFSIVIDVDKAEMVNQLLSVEAPGRLPDGINMILGNKSREELIYGSHKREAFVREIKKMLEERVFNTFNEKQQSTEDMIQVRDVLISKFVTQTG